MQLCCVAAFTWLSVWSQLPGQRQRDSSHFSRRAPHVPSSWSNGSLVHSRDGTLSFRIGLSLFCSSATSIVQQTLDPQPSHGECSEGSFMLRAQLSKVRLQLHDEWA